MAHLYNLRRSARYRKVAARWEATQPSGIRIGACRKPDPRGRPGFLRVDTVHQGDWEGVKGVYHINAVDAETRWTQSGGGISASFLNRAGISMEAIVIVQSLAKDPGQLCSCFISHSTADLEFATLLYGNLQSNRVRCFFAPEDVRIGDSFRQRIDESIRIHDKLLLILSENSVRSDWVRAEVEAALKRERCKKKIVLFPIRIDDAVMETAQAWAAMHRRLRSRIWSQSQVPPRMTVCFTPLALSAGKHQITLSILVKLFWSLCQSLAYPLT